MLWVTHFRHFAFVGFCGRCFRAGWLTARCCAMVLVRKAVPVVVTSHRIQV